MEPNETPAEWIERLLRKEAERRPDERLSSQRTRAALQSRLAPPGAVVEDAAPAGEPDEPQD